MRDDVAYSCLLLRRYTFCYEHLQWCCCREVQSRFNWLDEKLVKDAKGHRPQHQVFVAIAFQDAPYTVATTYVSQTSHAVPSVQLYDPRTVTVPAEAFKKLSGEGQHSSLGLSAQMQFSLTCLCPEHRWMHGKLLQKEPVALHLVLSADSQKQYWEIKQKYRDVMLFFKVGTFYELYEDDAQIGHDVMGWKMTVSGVGHCRQVLHALRSFDCILCLASLTANLCTLRQH